VLAGNAKALVTVTMVVGLLGLGGYVGGAVAITGSTVNNAVQKANALNAITADYNTLGGVVSSFQSSVQACNGSLSCVTKLDGQVATAFQTFGTELGSAGIPSSYSGETSTLVAATGSVAHDLNQLAGATSASQYTSIGSSLNLQAHLNSWQSDYNQLSKSLGPTGS
jgi:chorismate synthase